MELSRKLIANMARRVKNSHPYVLAQSLKEEFKAARRLGYLDTRFLSLKPEQPIKGHVLLSNINEPFFLKPGQPVSHDHTHDWESLQIAKTFLKFGYQVDVINWLNKNFWPRKAYDFCIDARMNLERFARLLNSDCVKIMHIDTSHWIFHMTAQYERLMALQRRKGITLRVHKPVFPNWAIEHADCATILGNDVTVSTYRYANKPMYRVPISTPVVYPWFKEKDFDACRKRFLWFGSDGFVHKGLDLALDAFAAMPDYHLTVCGPIDKEPRFQQAFYKELYQTPNIRTLGWVDITSPEFIELTRNCVGLIFPSCAEGQCGGVVTCLHAGLIPAVSYRSGVDIDDRFGMMLTTCSIEEIQETARRIAELPVHELQRMSRTAWEFARAHHTRETYANAYHKIVDNLMTIYRK